MASVVAICISPDAGGQMKEVLEVEALAGLGLKGDRYATGEGSFNKGKQGKGQVTLINGIFFPGSGFEFADSRRNIVTNGVELNWLIGKEFFVGEALLRGIKYCDPCQRPSKISGKPYFQEFFFDRGGIVAEIITGGTIRKASLIIPPNKGY